MSCCIGQRWLSESENDLGLGIITELTFRTVSVFFPAVNEQRIYARDNAPLIRVLFNLGDEIMHQKGWLGRVEQVTVEQELANYVVKRLDNQQNTTIPESELAPTMRFSKPQDLLFSGQIDRSDRFALRYRTFEQQKAQFQSPLRGLRGTRAGLIPHQLHIAKEVGQRINPRVLLADEVGLGKTIEAGMILQQQLFSGRVQRALIIVPENLQHQWLVEMLRRFNLSFSLFDEERAADFAETEQQVESNPFESENLVICALDWLVNDPKRAQQALTAEFDLLIVDEAHHLAWSQDNPSAEYKLVEQFCRHIGAVLLLTATPEQLGQASHFARLSLLDPARFYDYQTFVDEQQHYQPVANAVEYLLSEQLLSANQQTDLKRLLVEPATQSLLDALQSDDPQQKHYARQQLIESLIDRHGTSRLLFRNTRQGVQGFPKRIYHPVPLAAPVETLSQTEKWTNFDPRIAWLMQFLQQHRQEKVLVICRYTETAIALERALREKEGIRAALFHQNLSIIERDRAAAYFADPDGAQVLLSSNIGSEGRNFQFSSHLVLFDLPEHPDLLEQCIGRLDRIGQTRDIQIFVPYFIDSPQQRLAQWYHQGLNAFEQTCPMAALIVENRGQKLQCFLAEKADLTDFDEFIRETKIEQQHLKHALEKWRDRLLELHSQGGEKAKRLAEMIYQQDNSPDLVNFSLNLFDIIGVEQDDLGKNSIVITPTGTMLVPSFPGLKEEGITVTFDRELALAREELEFLTWDHPILRNGMDLIIGSDIGKTALAMLTNPKLPTGTLLLELIYIIESQAPKALQLSRFLPPTPVRLLLDSKGNNLAPQVSFESLEKQLKPMAKAMAHKVVKMTEQNVRKLIVLSEQQMQQQSQQIIRQAQQQAELELTAQLDRLLALQQVNKAIRQDEIDSLRDIREQSLTQLAQANWRLDSLRLIVNHQQK